MKNVFTEHPSLVGVLDIPDLPPHCRPWRNENPGEGGTVLYRSATLTTRDGEEIPVRVPAGGKGRRLRPVEGGWKSVPYTDPAPTGRWFVIGTAPSIWGGRDWTISRRPDRWEDGFTVRTA